MTTLYVTEPYSIVKKDGETLLVQIPGVGDTPGRKVRVPLGKVSQVVIQGDSTLTTPALNALMEQKVDVCYLSFHGRFRGRLLPADGKHGLLRLAQHRAHHDPVAVALLAAAFVEGKLRNMRTLLMRANRKHQNEAVAAAVAEMKTAIDHVSTAADAVEMAENPQQPQKLSTYGRILGLEGAGSAAYFRVFGQLFNEDWHFTGRRRRPPTDPINALLSYGYTLLLNHVAAACQIVGFDPYIGYLHSTQYGKPALALDIMEEFRAPVVDSVVLSVLNTRVLQPDDFEETLGSYRMKDEARRMFIRHFEDRLHTEIQHPLFDYRASYRRCIELQARLVSKWLLDDIPAYRPLVLR